MLLFALLAGGCGSKPCGLAEIELPAALEAARTGSANRCQQQGLAEWVNNRKSTHGPWKQDVAVARSDDGLRWTALRGDEGLAKVVVPTAAVPEAVEGPDGKVWLFFVDGDLDSLAAGAGRSAAGFATRGLPGIGAFTAANSLDGLTFERVAVSIDGLGVGMFADPEIVPEPGGGWRMYYLAMSVKEYTVDAKWGAGEKHEIHSAVSKDLQHWRSEGFVLRGPFADPALACFAGGGCTLFSYGIDASYSADHQHFDYQGRWKGVGGFAPDVVSFSPTEARLFYNDSAMGAPLRAKVTRDAGLSWTDEPDASLDVYGEAVSVLQRKNGEWWMYFHTFKPGMRLPTVPDPESAVPRLPAGE